MGTKDLKSVTVLVFTDLFIGKFIYIYIYHGKCLFKNNTPNITFLLHGNKDRPNCDRGVQRFVDPKCLVQKGSNRGSSMGSHPLNLMMI